MRRWYHISIRALLASATMIAWAGCGTTRSTDTMRTATEQLLISDAIDRAVQSMNLTTLSGQSVFLDDTKLSDTVDRNYFISTLRQQLLASGCELRDKREDAEFVVEARAGAIGTDRNDLLFGLPSMNVPQIPLVQPVPAAIPEIPIAKRKDQRGVAKIAVFAYHRATGTPVWQSGIVRQESSANDVWIFGTGPFQRGTIYEGTEFAGTSIKNDPLKQDKEDLKPRRMPTVSLNREKTFTPPTQLAKKDTSAAQPAQAAVVQASHQESSTGGKAASPAPTAANPAVTAASVELLKQLALQSAGAAVEPRPVATPSPGATVISPPANASTLPTPVDTKPQPAANSAYARMGDATPLPQPRFNSPQ